KDEEAAPAFRNYTVDQLPVFTEGGVWMRMIAGTAYGLSSSVKTNSSLFYLHVILSKGSKFSLPMEHRERGVYVANGSIEVNGHIYTRCQLLVFTKKTDSVVIAKEASTLMLLGGEPLGKRF